MNDSVDGDLLIVGDGIPHDLATADQLLDGTVEQLSAAVPIPFVICCLTATKHLGSNSYNQVPTAQGQLSSDAIAEGCHLAFCLWSRFEAESVLANRNQPPIKFVLQVGSANHLALFEGADGA